MLTVVVRYEAPGDQAGPGHELLDAPATPSVDGIDAPAEWLPILAGSLAAEIGKPVHVTTPSRFEGQTGARGPDDPTITEMVRFEGVERVSGVFTVDCPPTVRATFAAWTSSTSGILFCGSSQTPEDRYARLARGYCLRTAAPPSDLAPAPFGTAD